jgi:FtsP/CotA-like multicopper oxidase with cupredoxin domain
MRGLFIALMIMGSIWTGGLVWSVFGGLVLVPSSTVALGAPRIAPVPSQSPPQPSQAKPSTSAPATKPGAGTTPGGHDMAGMPGMAGMNGQMPSHASEAPTATRGNQPLEPKIVDGVKAFELTASVIQWEVTPGEFVDAYAYNGMVPGPLLRVTEGDTVRIVLKNELPEPTILHIHGPALPNSMDGVPDVTQPLVQPGESFTYEFEIHPAGTFVYHTHHNSAVQEAKGLYGVLQVDPKGFVPTYDKEYFQVLSELGGFYVINGKVFPSTDPLEAKVGDRVRIHLINLGQMAHPMHSHGFATSIVATDGHPVEGAPLIKDTVNIAPGERYDLEFVADRPGAWVYHCHILSHVQTKGVEPGGMISVIKVTE